MHDADESLDRRTYLAALSAGTGLGLAGCLGDDDGDDDGDGDDSDDSDDSDGDEDHGERVETVQMEIIAGIGANTTFIEHGLGILGDALEEDLGLETETQSVELATFWDEVYNDDRSHHLHLDFKGLVPARLDPQPLLEPEKIQNAGANGRQSLTQFASCEYTQYVDESASATDEESRREAVQNALSEASQAVDRIPVFNQVRYGAYRTDQVEPNDSLGTIGIQSFNVDNWINSEGMNGNRRITYTTPTIVGTRNHLQTPNTFTLMNWSTMIYTPLLSFSSGLEIEPYLADDWTTEDEFRTYRFDLREDGQFSNGDPVTAEDVQFTFEYVEDNADILPDAEPQGYASIDVVDDYTVEFNFEESNPTWLRTEAFRWGILPRAVWEEQGATDNPESFAPDPIVGSGPYEINEFRREELLDLEPHDNYWDPPADGLTFQAFQDVQSGFRAYQNGEINIFPDISATMANDIRGDMSDTSEVTVMEGFTDWWLIPQTNFGPTKFEEFRLAVSQALDRQEINEVANYGDATPHLYSSILGQTHPFYPEDHEGLRQIAESAEGDTDVASQTLEDAGWTWDDDGNLRYPSDADLDPLWPAEETPMDYPEEWPCVEDLE